MIHLIKRIIPQSITRQMQVEEVEHVEPEIINEDGIPDDMPTVEEWFRIRVWNDEIEGRSLTN